MLNYLITRIDFGDSKSKDMAITLPRAFPFYYCSVCSAFNDFTDHDPECPGEVYTSRNVPVSATKFFDPKSFVMFGNSGVAQISAMRFARAMGCRVASTYGGRHTVTGMSTTNLDKFFNLLRITDDGSYSVDYYPDLLIPKYKKQSLESLLIQSGYQESNYIGEGGWWKRGVWSRVLLVKSLATTSVVAAAAEA